MIAIVAEKYATRTRAPAAYYGSNEPVITPTARAAAVRGMRFGCHESSRQRARAQPWRCSAGPAAVVLTARSRAANRCFNGVRSRRSTQPPATARSSLALKSNTDSASRSTPIKSKRRHTPRFTAICSAPIRCFGILGAKFPRVAANPPFGLDWRGSNGKPESSTVATWRMSLGLLSDDGCGALGRPRPLLSRHHDAP